MKRWIERIQNSGENHKIDVFLAEIKTVCEKHGMSIAHEDTGGAFIINNFKMEDIEWLLDAHDAT
jgi:hypothetical protein